MSNTIAQQQAAIARNQARVIDLLHWNPALYAMQVYNTGLQYLVAYIGNDEAAIDQLTARKEFWNWWKNQWNVRDDAFINEWDGLEDSIPRRDLESLYKELHNSKVLACEIHPPKIVYGTQFINIQMANQ